jgi:L-asparaginase
MDSPCSPLGLINPSWLSRTRAIESASSEDVPIPEGQWPWVEIVTSHAGAKTQALELLTNSGVDGLVLAGTGLGGLHQAWSNPLKQASDRGVALVKTSRTGAGALGGDSEGALAAGSLSGPRARIALQLALNAAKADKSLTWQDFFARIAVLPEFR